MLNEIYVQTRVYEVAKIGVLPRLVIFVIFKENKDGVLTKAPPVFTRNVRVTVTFSNGKDV